MSEAQLPPVDPNFRIIARNPENLHAYARGLLQHLRQIRSGTKSYGYPIATIKSAAVWLLESYADAAVAPSSEAVRLIEELLRPNSHAGTIPVRRSSEEAYWAAIQLEALGPPDPIGKQPSAATLYAVAKHVRSKLQNRSASQKTAEATVRGWRQLEHYRINVTFLRDGRVKF